ncbi:DUF3231 family protein [Bacillus luteolus]|uniref:DUF3231 family protein n=1 Tax=Litchfieldia luteola TaxID=682179 RepID=A0ABR9QPX8_9BACI|nr:DUF3231 family protein [Cytobacillus luteolus]MBE4910509.1 DUF3231 family protein [Cytobacillus luteolus]MBP1943685.1 hypothetical protein [Cytobacillus luteolus]
MASHSKIKLTSAEIATLWTTYQNDTLSICITEYFLAKNEDSDIEPIIQMARTLSEQNIGFITQVFNTENIPIPVGFSKEKDVFPNVPRIYEDTFFLLFLRQMAKVGMVTYSSATSLAVREDIVGFFQDCLVSTSNIYKNTTEVSVQKGVLVRPPYISYPEKVEFVEDKEYLSASLNPFTSKRPLNAIEVSHLFMNTQTNLLGSMLTTSFAQMAQSKEVREFMTRAQQIAQKHIKVFGKALVDNDMQAPMSWDTSVKNSTTPAFSDKLMMFITTLISNTGMGNYGLAASVSMRMDLGTDYFRLALEVARLGKSGADIMIKNGWLEEPPQSADRKKLSQAK